MDKQLIKKLIVEKQQQIGQVVLQRRGGNFDPKACYVLVGIRRAGKSYTLYQDIRTRIESHAVSPEEILYVNFEDERLASIPTQELGLLLEAYAELYEGRRPYIYFDEIQNVVGWEKFARRLSEEKYRVMITGSNARMLSREIASSLGGSYIQRNVYPFSFGEYLEWNGVSLGRNWEYDPEERRAVVRHFGEYFQYGGFAESFDKADRREWLTSLYQKILMGDIVERNRVRNPRVFRLLARKLAESVMQPSSLRRMENIVRSTGDSISPAVLKDYLEYMEDAYLTFAVPNLVSPLSEQATLVKRYFADNGILSLFLMGADTKLLENMVAVQLNRRYHNTADEVRMFYYSKGVEVDFCVPEEGLAIQVSYSLEDASTYEREVGGLTKFLKAYKGYSGLIVTWDTECTIDVEGHLVEVVPVWKWMLRW